MWCGQQDRHPRNTRSCLRLSVTRRSQIEHAGLTGIDDFASKLPILDFTAQEDTRSIPGHRDPF